jgi:D-alanyl-D-alanine carboxypeptidase (penicillin-binding protein 5/6)
MIKRILSVFISVSIIISLSVQANAAVLFTPSFPIMSEAAVLVNLDKDVTIYEKNPTKKMYPASLTKIVTAMVVLDNVSDIDNTTFEAPLAVFDELYLTGASTVGFSRGEVTTVKDLMYSMLMLSACESAGILAYNIGDGDSQKFIQMMNEKAAQIGCTGTNFVNSHGLYDDNQYTNAHDMSLIGQYAYKNYPKLIEIACTRQYEMKATNYQEEGWKTITHTNKMLDPASDYYYQYVRGMKTGTLDESGRCLMTLAAKDGNNYLLVTLGAPQEDAEGETIQPQYEDHKLLYDWAFNTFAYEKILSREKEISEIKVRFGQSSDYVLLVPSEEYSMLWPNTLDKSALKEDISTAGFVDDTGEIQAPVKKGQVLGTYTLSLSGNELITTDLVAKNDVTLSQTAFMTDKASKFPQSGYFKLAITTGSALTAVYIIIFIAVAIKRSKEKKSPMWSSRKYKK